MRILHVASTVAPASGGPTQVLRSLAIAQADVGHKVAICTTDRGNPVQEKLPSDHFETFCPKQISLNVFPVVYGPLLLSIALGRWLRDNIPTFDIIHVHGLYRFPPTYAAYQARRQGIPFIVRPHGALDPYLYDKSSRSVLLKRMYEHWFDLPNLNAASALHYTAEEERNRVSFLRLCAPSFVLPNGLDWGCYDVRPPRGALRARWALGDAPTVLFLGRLHSVKGLNLLIPAFDTLRRTLPNAQLVIAGPENDAYGLKVRAWVRDRGLGNAVHFVGPLDRADVIQAYVDADVFCLPSYTESFGMTVAEAMACALPVVISDQVHIQTDVARATAGLVTRCDSGELAEALRILLANPTRRRAMGEAGRRLVQERYTWPVIVDALTREYQAIIGRHRRTTIGTGELVSRA